MEDKRKIKTTPTGIYQQPLEDKWKIKTALTTNNQWKQSKNRKNTEYLPIAIRKQQKNKHSTNNQ
jgi:hypothetical protein